MNRKQFLQLSSFASVAIAFPLLQSCHPSTTERTASQPVFLSRLFDNDTIKQTGKIYLTKTPSENSYKQLIQLLAGDEAIANSTDKNAIRKHLDERIKNDFETGNTVLIKGWELAVTEARQCALFSLL